jgi:endosialidase-like protein
MNPSIQFKMTVPTITNSIGRSPLRLAFLLIPLVLGCFALSPTARAVLPAPDGGYPNNNTAEGDFALFSLTIGSANTAIGFSALHNNTTSHNNTATGFDALFSNTDGSHNTATGSEALIDNTTGSFNTAIGFAALHNNTTGNNNTATGFDALAGLFGNTIGHDNTANGFKALHNNTTGDNNTATGVSALSSTITGSNNIALGFQAGFNTSGSCNIDIGHKGVAGESNTIRIGTVGGARACGQTATFIAGVIGAPIAGPTVHISGTGQLGIGPPSSVRFKQNIKPMDKASEAILALKPVTFRYKKQLDPEGITQFGLVAEDVEKVDPALVTRNDKGEVETVRYDAVNAMLLNEFLKEHKAVQEQGATVAELKKQIATLVATVKEQASQIQKVSAQIEVTKPAPQTVLNNQ